MSIVVVGLNHKTAPVDVREKISFPEQEKSLKALKDIAHVEEGLILSTCNRVELCVSTQNEKNMFEHLEQFMSTYHGYDISTLSPHLYKLDGRDAIHHTFRVTSSLDSLVVGEAQILGQVKQAYFQAKDAKMLGPVLHRFYHKAFSVAKRVRSETTIGADHVSVGSVAIDLSEKIFDQLRDKIVLLMGSGEMIENAAQRLIQKGVTQFYITNRTQENVVRLTHSLTKSHKVHFRYIPLGEYHAYLDKVDVVLVSTSSPTYLLTRSMMEGAMKKRKQRPILCIDISVPRNIDPSINELGQVYLYDIDDLELIVKENTHKRAVQAKQAEIIVEQEATQFHDWLSALQFTPTLKSIRKKVEEVRKDEIDNLMKYLKNIQPEERAHIEKFSKRLANKILHDPFVSIKEEVKSNNVRFVEFLRQLFRLS